MQEASGVPPDRDRRRQMSVTPARAERSGRYVGVQDVR